MALEVCTSMCHTNIATRLVSEEVKSTSPPLLKEV